MSDWIKWKAGFNHSPLVFRLAKHFAIDDRVAACCLMEFWCWFDGCARGFRLKDTGFSQLENNLQWPSGFVESLVEFGALSRSDGELTARDRGWAGTGQRKRKHRRIYFMRSGTTGLIKIGISHDPKSRARHLSVTEKIQLLGDYSGDESEERRLHAVFKKSRKHGEWFEPSNDLVDFIQGKGFTVNAAG
jgi:hypothetical protein